MQAVIIGGGHAGGAAALALARRPEVAAVTLIGAEDVPPHERPSLSKGYLAGAEGTPTWLADPWPRTVDLRLGEDVVEIDRANRTVRTRRGASIGYDRLFLAMGARCRRLGGVDGERVSVLRTIADADGLRPKLRAGTRLLVVGGGVIGLEAASTARALGAEVAVIEAAPRVMARNAPPDVAARISSLHASHGVRILTGCRIDGVETLGGITAHLSGGTVLEADHLLVGIGVTPDTSLAEDAGLACARGVKVDDAFRTSDPAIFAIGDLAEGPGGCRETWANAQESAERAVAAALGEDLLPHKAPSFWTDQYGVSFHFVGDPLGTDEVVERTGGDVRLYFKDGHLSGGVTIDQPRELAALRRLFDNAAPITVEDARDEDVALRSLTRRTRAPA